MDMKKKTTKGKHLKCKLVELATKNTRRGNVLVEKQSKTIGSHICFHLTVKWNGNIICPLYELGK